MKKKQKIEQLKKKSKDTDNSDLVTEEQEDSLELFFKGNVWLVIGCLLLLGGLYFVIPPASSSDEMKQTRRFQPAANALANKKTQRTVTINLSQVSTIKKTGHPWNDNSNIRFDYGGVKIRMDKIYRTAKANLTLDNNDAHQILFFNDSEQIGSISIPAHPLPSPGGLYAHTIEIPENIQKQGFNLVHIKPTSGDSYFALGHFQLLE